MADQAAPPHAAPAAPPLVGRGRELATLRDGLAAALAGHGSLVLIGGEAGIGKTTLAEALCAEATTQGVLVLVGPCYDLAETPPYGPWAEALDRWPAIPDFPPRPALLGVADAAGVAETQAMRFARLRGVLLAAAARRPLVLLLDDLHWADPASLELLRFLARGLADAAILLIGTYRAEDLRRGHSLYALLPALVREAHALRLDLRPLGDDDLRALVRARHALTPWDEARLVAYLGERAGGNPLFAGELLRALAEEGVLRPAPADSADGGDGAGWALGGLAGVPVPALLRQVIDARVARLGEGTYRLLGLAATIGQEVPLALWRAAGAGDAAALAEVVERALAAGVLGETADGRGVHFAHALIREALYAGVPLPRRQGWHRTIAEALLAAPTPDPDAVAGHLLRAGDPRAAEWLVKSGEGAQRAYAWLQAAERYEAALALLRAQGAGAGERAWLLVRLALVRRYNRSVDAVAYLEEATSLAAATDDAALRAYVRFYLGLLRCFNAQYGTGIADLEAGVAALDQLSPAERQTDAAQRAGVAPSPDDYRGVLVVYLAVIGRHADALALGEGMLREADPTARLLPGTTGLADTYNGLGQVYADLGQVAAACAAYYQAREIYLRAGNPYLAAVTTTEEMFWVLLPYLPDRNAEWAVLIDFAETALARTEGVRAGLAPRVAHFARLVLTGAWDEASQLAQAIRAQSSDAESFATPALLGPLARAQGDTARAHALVRETLPDGPETSVGTVTYAVALAMQRLAATLALEAGDHAAARTWLVAHDRWLAWGESVLGGAEGQLGWAALARAQGEGALARRHARAGLAHASAPRQPLALLAAHRLLSELDTDAGQLAEAHAHLDAALALADACAAPYERALTLLALAEAHLTGGEPESARVALGEAGTILAALGAAPALARAAARAARLAAPPPTPPAPAAYPAGLSAREVEVLRLVAAGLTNPAVAARLFLSPRTVGQHLRAVYAKLGVTTRTAAARFAQDHDLL